MRLHQRPGNRLSNASSSARKPKLVRRTPETKNELQRPGDALLATRRHAQLFYTVLQSLGRTKLSTKSSLHFSKVLSHGRGARLGLLHGWCRPQRLGRPRCQLSLAVFGRCAATLPHHTLQRSMTHVLQPGPAVQAPLLRPGGPPKPLPFPNRACRSPRSRICMLGSSEQLVQSSLQ